MFFKDQTVSVVLILSAAAKAINVHIAAYSVLVLDAFNIHNSPTNVNLVCI
jgi:hypothetical protein